MSVICITEFTLMSKKKTYLGQKYHTLKLLKPDEVHVEKQVKILGKDDIKFKDMASAIRHYVRLGIVSEKNVDIAHSLQGKIVKTAQKDVVREELKPLKNIIDSLINAIESLEKKQEESRIEVANSLNVFSIDIQQMINESKQDDHKYSTEILRNVYMLRSIMTVYLLAYKTGRVEGEMEKNWQRILDEFYQLASSLAQTEIQNLSADEMENRQLRELSQNLFKLIKHN